MELIGHRYWPHATLSTRVGSASFDVQARVFNSDMAGPALPDDRELAALMALAQGGDRAAYARVLRGCADIIDRLRADDSPHLDRDEKLVENCLRTIHAALHTFHPKRSFIRWVAAIARHHGLSSQG